MTKLIVSQETDWCKEIRVSADGASYFSIRATARLAGVDDSQLSKNLKKGAGSLEVKSAETLTGKGFEGAVGLQKEGAVLEKSKLVEHLTGKGFEGAVLAQCSRTGVPDKMAAAIIRYYAMYAGTYCNDTARQTLEAMSELGVRTFAHKLTGWTPVKPDKTVEEFLQRCLPATPKAWECKFKPEFWAALERLYGLRRGQQACGMFISHWVYGWFPVELRERLNEINPVTGPNYQRHHRHHQHFEAILELTLEMHISNVTTNLIRAKSRQHFKRLMKGVPQILFRPQPTLDTI